MYEYDVAVPVETAIFVTVRAASPEDAIATAHALVEADVDGLTTGSGHVLAVDLVSPTFVFDPVSEEVVLPVL